MALRLLPPKSEEELAARLARKRMRRRRLRRRVAVLPTLCTLANLLCGFLAVFFASRPAGTVMLWDWTPLTFAASCVFAGMAFDMLDGRLARLTHNTSDLGEQLDSMADMTTFGVAPAFLAVQLVVISTPFASQTRDFVFDRVVLVVAAIYVACAALRLARFNVQARLPEFADHLNFMGLPSPAAAGTVASLILLHQNYLADFWRRAADNPDLPMPLSIRVCALVMVAVMGLAALMMVSRFRYAHLTNRLVRGRAKFANVVRLVIVLLLLLVRPRESAAGAFVLYALSAPSVWLWSKLFRNQGTVAAADGRRSTPMPDEEELQEKRA